jgi:hypothetical protein
MLRCHFLLAVVLASLSTSTASAAPLHLLDQELELHLPRALRQDSPRDLLQSETMLSPLAAAILSVFLPGLGQTFSGRFQTGFVILGTYVLVALLAGVLYDAGQSTSKPALKVAGYAVMAGDLGLWGWSVYDAYVNVDSGSESPNSDGR